MVYICIYSIYRCIYSSNGILDSSFTPINIGIYFIKMYIVLNFKHIDATIHTVPKITKYKIFVTFYCPLTMHL